MDGRRAAGRPGRPATAVGRRRLRSLRPHRRCETAAGDGVARRRRSPARCPTARDSCSRWAATRASPSPTRSSAAEPAPPTSLQAIAARGRGATSPTTGLRLRRPVSVGLHERLMTLFAGQLDGAVSRRRGAAQRQAGVLRRARVCTAPYDEKALVEHDHVRPPDVRRRERAHQFARCRPNATTAAEPAAGLLDVGVRRRPHVRTPSASANGRLVRGRRRRRAAAARS